MNLIERFDRRFAPLLDAWWEMPFAHLAPALPKIDLAEDEERFVAKVLLPGFDKQDIRVGIDGRRVTIDAARRANAKEEELDIVRREWTADDLSRAFELPQEVDGERADAKYENGVLTLVLPKQPRASVKKLTVH